MTDAVVLAGYVRPPEALQAAYRADAGAVDAWAREVDLERVVATIVGGERELRTYQARAERGGSGGLFRCSSGSCPPRRSGGSPYRREG